METELLSNVRGNVQALRKIWNSNIEEQEKTLRLTSIPSHTHSNQQQQQKSSRVDIPTLEITNETTSTEIIKKELPITSNNDEKITFESVEKLPPIKENISLPISSSRLSTVFKHQAQSVAVLKKAVTNMTRNENKNILCKNPKKNGIYHWHITRHVFRSGLIFNRTRRASDSILPLLIKTHKAYRQSPTDSLNSTLSASPFEDVVDYITSNNDNDEDFLVVSKKTKRSKSDTIDCIRQNRLDDSIFQYEMIIRHLKNYEKFMSKYPVPSSSSSPPTSYRQQKKMSHPETINTTHKTKEEFLAKTPISNRQTQSLSRNIGRTFSEFIINDLFLSPPSKSSNEQQNFSNIPDTTPQIDLNESTHDVKDETKDSFEIIQPVQFDKNSSIPNEEAKSVLNELDTILDNSEQGLLIIPNNAINVIVLNLPVITIEDTSPIEKPLMQHLFEGKKSAYKQSDLNMKSIRLPDEMMPTYEIAKRRCFFNTEELIYTTKMIKVSRRGYTQHIRIFCITTQRIYNITKRNPYPKESLFFSDIIGITCTPYKDGFVCIHTKESYEDRGDWLIIVDNPCELITQLFMIMKRTNNDDHFLKIQSDFKHQRRFYGETSSTECSVQTRIADSFRIKKADFDVVIIYTPS